MKSKNQKYLEAIERNLQIFVEQKISAVSRARTMFVNAQNAGTEREFEAAKENGERTVQAVAKYYNSFDDACHRIGVKKEHRVFTSLADERVHTVVKHIRVAVEPAKFKMPVWNVKEEVPVQALGRGKRSTKIEVAPAEVKPQAVDKLKEAGKFRKPGAA